MPRSVHRLTLAPALAGLGLLMLLTSALHATEGADLHIPYRGEVIDQEYIPITGVFMLTFRLHSAAETDAFHWQEVHWVAVHEGMYDVVLGTLTPIGSELLEEPQWISVRLGSTGEITRHEASLQPRTEAVDETRLAEIERMTFADIAERALHAEFAAQAENCRTLDGRSAQDLDRYDELNERIRELSARERPEAGRAASPSLGRTTQTLPAIGGRGGQPYDRACPPNHVVTGARGRSGQLIDSMELICTPLQ